MKQLPMLFSYEDVKNIYPNRVGFNSFLMRSLKSGKIKQIKRGLYALVNPLTNEIYANKFQIASKLFPDSYFSYHEALEYYGLAVQSYVSSFVYISKVRVPDLEFEEIVYRSKKETINVQKLNHLKENNINVVTLERAIIDSIDNLHLGGGLEEVENALDMCPRIDINQVEELLNIYNKSFLYQKVGYLFEKHYGERIPGKFYNLCLSKIGSRIFYLEPNKLGARLNSKWKLMIKENYGGLPNELF